MRLDICNDFKHIEYIGRWIDFENDNKKLDPIGSSVINVKIYGNYFVGF